MGHYRSEMGMEERDRQRAAEKEARRRQYTKLIKKDISERGIARVLTEMLLAPNDYKNDLWYSRPENGRRNRPSKKAKTQTGKGKSK